MSAPTFRRELDSTTDERVETRPSAAEVHRTAEVGAGAADTALHRFLAAGAQHGHTPEHQQLWSSLAQATAGGKRLRPALFHSVYTALGGRDTAVAGEVAAALELLRTALVIHDDVIDGDTVRRGQPNVVGSFAEDALAGGHDPQRATHFGQTAAILTGDLALAGAVRTLACAGPPPRRWRGCSTCSTAPCTCPPPVSSPTCG